MDQGQFTPEKMHLLEKSSYQGKRGGSQMTLTVNYVTLHH